jgi:hypothetical protein
MNPQAEVINKRDQAPFRFQDKYTRRPLSNTEKVENLMFELAVQIVPKGGLSKSPIFSGP